MDAENMVIREHQVSRYQEAGCKTGAGLTAIVHVHDPPNRNSRRTGGFVWRGRIEVQRRADAAP